MFVQSAKISMCSTVLLWLLATQLKACTIPLYCLRSYQCTLGWNEFFNVLTSCVLDVIFLLVAWKHSLKFHYTIISFLTKRRRSSCPVLNRSSCLTELNVFAVLVLCCGSARLCLQCLNALFLTSPSMETTVWSLSVWVVQSATVAVMAFIWMGTKRGCVRRRRLTIEQRGVEQCRSACVSWQACGGLVLQICTKWNVFVVYGQ